MNTLPSNELTAINNEIRRARTLANIERRALCLWADGYTVKNAPESGCYYVTTPAKPGDVNGDTKNTYKVRCSEEAGFRCTCPANEEYSTCKHLIAVRNLIEEGAKADAEWDALEANNDAYSLRSDLNAYGY